LELAQQFFYKQKYLQFAPQIIDKALKTPKQQQQ
jgi:hypothetical protein